MVSSGSSGSTQNDKDKELIIIEIKSMSVLIRYTVSISIGFTTTVLFLIFVLVFAVFFIDERANDDDIGLQLIDVLLALDSMVNFICVSMLFEFDFINKFYTVGCKICNNLARNRLAKRVKINVDELYV